MLPSAELVLKTANHIEKNPRSYRYASNQIPRCSNDVGCILGWMAHFASAGDYESLTPELIAKHAVAALRTYAAQYPQAPGLPVWARMRDREAAAAQHSYGRFRARLALYPGASAPTPAS